MSLDSSIKVEPFWILKVSLFGNRKFRTLRILPTKYGIHPQEIPVTSGKQGGQWPRDFEKGDG
jgi:hypothetical protein